MCNRIIICGGNGAGKSTLGKALAKELDWEFRDIEEYYFPADASDYNYEKARTREGVAILLLEDMKKYNNLIVASVKGNYGKEVESMFTCAILISVSKETRLQRVRSRSYQKFGDRMLKGGDLYEKENRFFDMVEKRSEKDVIEWLNSVDVPIIRVDGNQPIESNVQIIKTLLI